MASRSTERTLKLIPVRIGEGEGRGEQAIAQSCLVHGMFAVLCRVCEELCLTDLRTEVLNKRRIAQLPR